jgi:broad specificity phosphatase PhoE
LEISDRLKLVVLVRHGETEGESSIRYHGAGDVVLSEEGRAQARAAAQKIGDVAFDLHMASSLSRAAESARIIRPDGPIELDDDLREIHFGRWEGLTREEIRALDPELDAAWSRDPLHFDFPDGEKRTEFNARVDRALERAFCRDVERLLLVAHKGVVRRGFELLTHETLPAPHPDLGEVFLLERNGGRFRQRGRS